MNSPPPAPRDVVLVALNARWIHASFGARCLLANLGPLRPRAELLEFETARRPLDVVEAVLALAPRVVGLGVYVWNARESREVVALLKRLAPGVVVVLGGPEVSHETEQQEIAALADYIVCGEGEVAFSELVGALLDGARPEPRIVHAPPPEFDQMAWPYPEYTDRDLAQRLTYVEASRGCPFRCEFCLSSLDQGVRAAPLAAFLAQLDDLLLRGATHLKFVDRTFNLHLDTARAVLEWCLARWRPGVFFHFEMVPDRLPAALREVLAQFPPGAVQLEVGIQTFDEVVAARIQRRQRNAAIEDNLRWLRAHTAVHVHADLIAGLPGEDLDGLARGFDRLWRLGPHEIQLGILKRLRGTPIARHDQEHGMVWADDPPYEILQTAALPFTAMQEVKRFARYWDLVANSGRFPAALALLLGGGAPFARFRAFCEFAYARTRATHAIAKARWVELLREHLTAALGVPSVKAAAALAADDRPRRDGAALHAQRQARHGGLGATAAGE